ncbi:uncharacterized protein ETH isoform X2 [Venturia canescens]|uniref:uncharacterized protein ETH isoform X2 n=1 Tax=Venturia canescens TaxID=32260 RepID=UPI001C9C0CA8|nr:uncharacterized protein LOC122418004 isoform X2 [Venturia canescens]
MKIMRNMCLRQSFTLVVVFFAVNLFSTSWQPVEADEVPAFFLKIAKNIPRVGRSDRFEDYFLKAAKNIPRIGRRAEFQEPSQDLPTYGSDGYGEISKRMIQAPPNTPTNNPLKPNNVPRIGRRDTYRASQRMLLDNENQARNEATKRMLSIPSIGQDDPSWSHFPLAIEGPPELWRTLAAYTNERMGFGSDDIDNEIWQRDKRTENGVESEP